MKQLITTAVLVLGLLSGIGAVVRFGVWPLVRVDLPATAVAAGAGRRLQPRMGVGEADSSATLLVVRDPFRVARRPASVAYDPARVSQPDVPLPPKPTLSLIGLVAGAEPTALVEGFSGVEGARVVRVGDVIAGLTVRRIASGGVMIVGMDTVWVLTVREPWR